MSSSPVRLVSLRVLMYATALLLNILSSIVLARRLSQLDYAAFQFATKRIITYATVPLGIFSIWMYRYLVVRRRGSFEAGLAIAFITAVLGVALGFIIELLEARVNAYIAVAAGLAVMGQAALGSINTMLDAVRPLRLALLTLVYRLVYSITIVIVLYVITPSLLYAFIATSVIATLSALLGLKWLVEALGSSFNLRDAASTLSEWLRTSHPLLIGYAMSFLASLDATVAYPLVGSDVVAAFFVASSVATLVRESSNTGLRYLHSYVMRTRDVVGGIRSLYLILTLAIPLLVYAAVHPIYIIYVFNFRYTWAAEAFTVFMLTAIVEIINGGLSNISMGVIGEVGPSSVQRFTRLMSISSIPNVIYLAGLVVAFVVLRGMPDYVAILAWSAVYMARFILSVLLYYFKFIDAKGRAYLRALAYRRLTAYIVVSAVLALAIRPWERPQVGLLRSIEVIVPPAAIYLSIYYLIVLLLDRELRTSVRRLVAALMSQPSGWRLLTGATY